MLQKIQLTGLQSIEF